VSAPARAAQALAPAKVNLVLEVLGRRPDGYHELRTLMVALELADRVVARRDPALEDGQVRLALCGPAASADVPRDADNLVVRAARAVLERAAGGGGLALELDKHVPSQAGLGGGSADAAAALLAAEEACGVDLGAAARRELLAGLGSDCVFFEAAGASGAAWCRGRGERVEPLPAPSPAWWVALVVPAVRAPTAAVYGALGIPLSHPPAVPTVRTLSGLRASAARAACFNQLEAAATVAVPELRRWREALDSAGADHFRLSGSGSAFFGLYDDADETRRGLESVLAEAERRGLAVRGRWVTRTLGRASHVVRSGA
jgi:4-diphosphocytidyl-2-C-methyl-D-erythritol kinase